MLYLDLLQCNMAFAINIKLAVSTRNLLSDKVTGMAPLLWSCCFSLLEKSPSGPTNNKIFFASGLFTLFIGFGR